MVISANAISKINSVTRCNQNNIQQMTKIFKTVNDRVRIIIDKILMTGERLAEAESRELQQLLRLQNKLRLVSVDPGSGSVATNLFNNECHRVRYLTQIVREIERRHRFIILDETI